MEFIQKKPRLFLAIAGCFLLMCFFFFSREVKRGFLKQADFDTTVRIQDKMPKRLDAVWDNAAFFVEPGPSVAVVLIITLIALIKAKTFKKRLSALAIPLIFGLIVLGESYGKSVVHHPSPPFFMIKHPTAIFPQFYVNEQFSYPSGHTARAVYMALVILFIAFWQYKIKSLKTVLKHKSFIVLCIFSFCYVSFIAVGKIYLGQHWLSDVIGGGFLGGGLAAITASILL